MRARLSTGVVAVAALAGAVGLGGCAADAEQYQRDAERFVSGDDVFNAYAIDFRDPVCTAPAATNIGTSFACTATGDNGLTYDFTLQITGDRAFALTAITPRYPVPTTEEPGEAVASTDVPSSSGPVASTTTPQPTTTVSGTTTTAA